MSLKAYNFARNHRKFIEKRVNVTFNCVISLTFTHGGIHPLLWKGLEIHFLAFETPINNNEQLYIDSKNMEPGWTFPGVVVAPIYSKRAFTTHPGVRKKKKNYKAMQTSAASTKISVWFNYKKQTGKKGDTWQKIPLTKKNTKLHHICQKHLVFRNGGPSLFWNFNIYPEREYPAISSSALNIKCGWDALA